MKNLILFILIGFVASTQISAQENPEDLNNGPSPLPLPESGYWFNADTAMVINPFVGRSFVMVTFWNAGDPEVQSRTSVLDDLSARHQHIIELGIHIPLNDMQKDSALVSCMAKEYNLSFPQFNDTSNTYNLELSDLPAYALYNPDGTFRYLVKGSRNLFDADSETMISNMEIEIVETAKKYNGPGKTLFPSYRPTLKKSISDFGILSSPSHIETDNSNAQLFISDTGHDRIIICTPNGEVLHCIGSSIKGNQDGDYMNCQFNRPQGLSFDANNNKLYVADTGNNTIRLVDLNKQTVSTFYGNNERSWDTPNAIRESNAPLNRPTEVLVDGYRLLVTMAGSHQFLELNLETLEAEPLIGSGDQGSLFSKKMRGISLSEPSGLIIDSENRMLFTDAQRASVYWLDRGKVQYLIGKEGIPGSTEGDFETARVMRPEQLVVNKNRLYLIDSYSAKISRVDLEKETIRALTFDVGDSLVHPTDIAWLNGELFICDKGDNQILVNRNGALQGLKISHPERLNRKMRNLSDINMTETLVIHESQQNTIQLDFKLPDEYLFDIDSKSQIFSTASQELFLQESELGNGPLELLAFAEKLRFQITLQGELNFCELSDPSKCYRKDLQIIIPVEKSAEADTKSSIEINLLQQGVLNH